MAYRSSFALLYPASVGENPQLVVSLVGRDFSLIRLPMVQRVTPSTTAGPLSQSRQSLAVRPSNFFSSLMAKVNILLSFVKSTIMIGSTRKVAWNDTTALPDAIQQYFSVTLLRHTREVSVCRVYDTAVLRLYT